MPELILFHHAQGLTAGVTAFAEALRAAGHTVHLPDLFEGRTFTTLDQGMAYVEATGFETIVAHGLEAAAGLPAHIVVAGMSLGVMPAQALLEIRPGIRAALFMHSAVPEGSFGGSFPPSVPIQIHTREADPWGDAELAREAAAAHPELELFLYPGSAHLFTDDTLADFDPQASALLLSRALAFLTRLG